MSKLDLGSLSDEEFMNQPIPEMDSDDDTSDVNNDNESSEEDNEHELDSTLDNSEEGSDDELTEEGDSDGEGEEENSGEDSSDTSQTNPMEGEGEGTTEQDPEDDNESNQETDSDQTDADGFKEQVLRSFKANGETITPRNAEDVVRLMQMGANYTKKMQAMAPQRKIIMMLERHDLLDEDKLSYLIDVNNKNPEAIQKLLSDAKIDPMDLDVDEENSQNYVPTAGNKVSDKEADLRDIAVDLSQTAEGQRLIQAVDRDWDQDSKNQVWDNPSILVDLKAHSEAGIYQQVVSEIQRQKTLGYIPATVPFLQAYKAVGDQLDSQGAFDHTRVQSPPSRPTAITKGKPKSVANVEKGSKAKSAGITRGSGKNSIANTIKADMGDDEFLKNFDSLIS